MWKRKLTAVEPNQDASDEEDCVEEQREEEEEDDHEEKVVSCAHELCIEK